MTVDSKRQAEGLASNHSRREAPDGMVDEILSRHGLEVTAAYVTPHMARAAVEEALQAGIELGQTKQADSESPNGQGERYYD